MSALKNTNTPEASLKRKRKLSETLNNPDWVPSDAQRAVMERKRRLQRKQKLAWITQKVVTS